MTDESNPTPAKLSPKRRYVSPQVTAVPLRPEEAVLGACKMVGISGPAADDCTTGSCMSLGS
ncbi:MAG: hypothetical protein SFV15_02140 [Polyangiaceae bacterium]|nr:hypothetical protein [Polyangiaceae bacterium]